MTFRSPPRLAAALLCFCSTAALAGSIPFQLGPGPRLSLPWAEHGRLTQVTSGQQGWSQEAYVVPRRPGRNLVRYFDFNWRDYDFLDDDGSAGVRLYFYDREYPVARIAAGLIRQSWAYLSDRFQYKPSVKVPYILYNTYREFLETNVFEVQEGVLGVTSPQDLKMSLPYAGERELFREVSTHEMTHQFHIQKVAERAASAGLESPIGAFPLWFTEGLAEYYAHNQLLDSETEMFLRDIVLNPNGEIGYDIPTLEEDRPYAYLYTYKYGQAKLVFLSETYGERVIQGVLDQSPRLAGTSRRGESREGFMQLLGRIAGEQPAQMDARWHTWLRKRVLPTYLSSKQDLPDVTELKLPDELDGADTGRGFVTSRDGNLIFYRGVERETARAKLVILDRRDPSSSKQIAIDQHPGTESLHPVLHGVNAVCDTGIAWLAESGESDVLHYRTMQRREKREGDNPRVRVDLELGPTRRIHIVRDGLIEAGDPTFSPDGDQLAFYGLDRDGKLDIYTLDLKQQDPHARRLTEDLYAERDLSWGDQGIVYASDATESGKFNLFRLNPVDGTRVRLTDSPVDQRFPLALEGGAVIFTSNAGGKNDLWFLQNGRIKRITDFGTSLAHGALAAQGVYGTSFYGGRYRLFEVSSADLLSLDEQDAIPASYLSTLDKPIPFPDDPIPFQAPSYEPFNLAKNWRVEGGGAAVGGAGVGYAPVGQGGIIFADVLRDRTALINLAIYGSFDLTDALAFYVDRSKRLTWGIGAFYTFQQGRDTRFPSAALCNKPPIPGQSTANACQVFYLQKEGGVEGLLSYPLSTFSRLEGTARVQGVSRSILGNGIFDRNFNPVSISPEELNGIRGADPEAEISGSYGWDTTRYGAGGAIGGSSFLVNVGVGDLPTRGNDGLFAYAQTDAITTFRIIGRSKLNGRLAAGLAQGSRFGRHFYLSSFDNLRGFRFSDPRLLGDGYYVGQAEFQFPLDVIIRFAFFSGITGVVGFDFGGVFETHAASLDYPQYSRVRAAVTEAWANRTADYVLGVNLGLGPFELRVQFAHGIDIGGIVPETDESGKPTWVPNISLHYAYF